MMTHFPDLLGEVDVQWLGHSQAQSRQVLQGIAAQQDGAVLFHCMAGKDRTGIIAGLLLDLAGVPKAGAGQCRHLPYAIMAAAVPQEWTHPAPGMSAAPGRTTQPDGSPASSPRQRRR